MSDTITIPRPPAYEARQYPHKYEDPDAVAAYHLLLAAYHLIEAGRGDDALPLVDCICKSFADRPVKLQGGLPVKTLGDVKYFPSGILKAKGSGGASIAAPPYDIGSDSASISEKSRVKDAAAACKSARIGWFPSRQIMSVITGRRISPGKFRPGKILANAKALCAYGQRDIAPEATAIAAEKLRLLLGREHNLLAGYGNSDIYNDLRRTGITDNGFGFAWLTEQQASDAAAVLTAAGRGAVTDLSCIDPPEIYWSDKRAAQSSAFNREFTAMIRTPGTGNLFLDRLSATTAEMGGRGYYDYRRHKILHSCENAIRGAAETAMNADRLIRCHAALLGSGNDWLVTKLSGCGIIDESLTDTENLWRDIAELAAYTAYKDCPEPGLAAAAIETFRSILDRPGIKELFTPDVNTSDKNAAGGAENGKEA